MKKMLMILSVFVLASLLVACGGETDTSNETNGSTNTGAPEANQNEADGAEVDAALEEEVENLLLANLEHSQNENLDLYMDTLIEAHQFEETRELLELIFEAYDLEYTLEAFEIIEANDDQSLVVVKAVQTTVATWIADGYEFDDNRLTVEHTLVRENGSLKFSTTEVIEMNSLQ